MKFAVTSRPAIFAAASLSLACVQSSAQAAPFPSVRSNAITTIASTVPSNGDVNPYGVAVVPATTGSLVKGNILVSNFNNSHNLQGTGTTIMQIAPNGSVSTFAQVNPHHLPGPCPGGIGLTTALAVTSSGWVFVGSLPTTDGTSKTARAGCILVLNSRGEVAETLFGSLINGPWDMAALDAGSHVSLFVTNVLNGTVAGNGHVVNGGTVIRIDLVIHGSRPRIESVAVIGSSLAERTDPAALVVGPTGLALSQDNQWLYVSDTVNSRIAAILNPLRRTTSVGIGRTVTMGGTLNGPLGLAIAPIGDILTVNAGDGYLVWTTPHGNQIRKDLLDSSGSPPGAGALFGLAVVTGVGFYFVDDVTNTLNLFH